MIIDQETIFLFNLYKDKMKPGDAKYRITIESSGIVLEQSRMKNGFYQEFQHYTRSIGNINRELWNQVFLIRMHSGQQAFMRSGFDCRYEQREDGVYFDFTHKRIAISWESPALIRTTLLWLAFAESLEEDPKKKVVKKYTIDEIIEKLTEDINHD